MADLDAEVDAIVAMLESARLLETLTDDHGKPAMRLTHRGAKVGRAMAMAGEDAHAEAVLNALLHASE